MHVYTIHTAEAFYTNNENDPQSQYANLVIKCYEVMKFDALMEATMTITIF